MGVDELFSFNNSNDHLKTECCVYSGCPLYYTEFVWRSDTIKCHGQAKIKEITSGGVGKPYHGTVHNIHQTQKNCVYEVDNWMHCGSVSSNTIHITQQCIKHTVTYDKINSISGRKLPFKQER